MGHFRALDLGPFVQLEKIEGEALCPYSVCILGANTQCIEGPGEIRYFLIHSIFIVLTYIVSFSGIESSEIEIRQRIFEIRLDKKAKNEGQKPRKEFS